MRKYVCLSVALVVLATIVTCGASAKVPDSSIQWANRLLAQSSFDVQLSGGYGTQRHLRDTEQAFASILSKYDKNDYKSWKGLAETQALLGKYEKAIESYRQAISHISDKTTLKKELTEVQSQQIAAMTALSTLPKGEIVLQAIPYTTHLKHNLWAVLSANVMWDKEYHYYWPTITDGHLTIFKGSPDSLKKVWRSPILGFPGHSKGEFSDIYLHVKDVTGDGNPDLVLPEVYYGASWCPSHIDIYTWRKGEIVHLLGAVSDDEIRMEDLNHDGRYEVMTDHAVGWTLSHAGQPRWLSIYAYKNNTYQPADKDFPDQYKQLYKKIRAALKEFPNDFELNYYLGRTYEIQGRPKPALGAYKKAEKEAAEERASNILNEIRGRISALSGRK